MQGAENVLIEQGVMGAIIILLVGAVVALWLYGQKKDRMAAETISQQSKLLRDQFIESLDDLRRRNDALTAIVEETIKEELELAKADAERSREFHTTLTILTDVIKEVNNERPGPNNASES